MKRFLPLFILLSACASFEMPNDFHYKTFQKEGFIISAWQKQTAPNKIYHVYIEGDGNAFNAHGMPTDDPTPKSDLMRRLAIQDLNPNVIYLARPCQFTKGLACQQTYWTTARFSPVVIEAEYQTLKEMIGHAPVILIGFSGGAQIAGLIAVTKDLNVKKVITIAGNLDHKAWTDYHHLPELSQSLNLADYKEKFAHIDQIHYVGEKDDVVPPVLTEEFVGSPSLIYIIKNATHGNINPF